MISPKGLGSRKQVNILKNNTTLLKGHSHPILVHFENKKYVLTSMNAHK